MKPEDSDLIARLNALPDQDRADLFEFLGATPGVPDRQAYLFDTLMTSITVHRVLGGREPN